MFIGEIGENAKNMAYSKQSAQKIDAFVKYLAKISLFLKK